MYDNVIGSVNCTVEKEVMINMNPVFQGGSGTWKVFFGENETDEKFITGLMLKDMNILAAGEKRNKEVIVKTKNNEEKYVNIFEETEAKKEEDYEVPTLIFTRLNHRGRSVWKKFHEIEGLKRVVKIIPHNQGGYIIAADIGAIGGAPGFVWFGHFDENGELIKVHKLQEPMAHMSIGDIIVYEHTDPKKSQYAYAVAAQYTQVKKESASHARLYLLNKDFQRISYRAYVTGLENKIEKLLFSPKENQIIGAGYVFVSDERSGGWVLGLDDTGNIRWQRQYPRGKASYLNVAGPYINDTVILAGHAEPLTENDHKAGWIMRLDTRTGEPVWQRYLRGEMEYEITDLRVSNDGVLSFLMNGYGIPNTPQVDFVRILSVSSGGLLIRNEAYFGGEGISGEQLLEGNRGSHVVIGQAKVGYLKEDDENGPTLGDNPDDNKVTDYSQQGWVMVERRAQAYNDPCLFSDVRAQ